MARNRSFRLAFILILFILGRRIAFAQPPDISYAGPQTYTITKAIAPLSPVNIGGIVPDGQVTTLAGSGNKGVRNGTGVIATFNFPIGLAVDGGDNVYLGDYLNSLIRQITATSIVTTFAGNGTNGNANSSTGLSASFNKPNGVAVDTKGNVYIADEGNNLIRKIDAVGGVTTLAGNGSAASVNNRKAGSASFNHPYGVAVDASGNIYVLEGASNVVRKITPAGVVTTFAGSGKAGWADGKGATAMFNDPRGIAVDAGGNVYIGDSGNNRIRKITPGGTVTTIAGSGNTGSNNGIGTLASFNYPYGVAVDGVGNVYVCDNLNNLIRKVDPGGVVSTLAGTGAVGATGGVGKIATFNAPAGLGIDLASNLYVADSRNNQIRKVITTGFVIDKPLPAGLKFDPSTGTISGTPTVLSPPVIYTITAYNTSGYSFAQVSIQVLNTDDFLFGPLPVKTVCDANFDPGATANLPLNYTSNNPGVATIISNKINITGPGTTTITAADGVSSGTQLLIVSTPLTPTITISPALLDTCQGATDTFTANVTGGGPSPGFQWQVNGQNTGINSAQFTTSNLNSGDKITCILTSNATCVTNASATSSPAFFTASLPVNVSVKITSSAKGPICPGESVVFTATSSASDKNPIFQWQVNGINKGGNSSTFTSNTLGNNDIVTCILGTNDKCLVNSNVISNPITVTLSPDGACAIIIPSAFSPNGDGINDLWDITTLRNYPGCTVAVYNRYGALVYRSVDYPKGWDGNYNGAALPGGTYYYIIDPKNGKKEVAGYVTILR